MLAGLLEQLLLFEFDCLCLAAGADMGTNVVMPAFALAADNKLDAEAIMRENRVDEKKSYKDKDNGGESVN